MEPTSKDCFDKEMPEWRTLNKAGNWKLEQTKQRKLLLELKPELRTYMPELAILDVLNRMANVAMKKKEALSWACEAAGLDTDAWSKKMAGSSSLRIRVYSAMRCAQITLQKSSEKVGG